MQASALPCPATRCEQPSLKTAGHGLTKDQTIDLAERLRHVTWRIWLAWVLVAALDPVFSSILATAANKQIARNAEYGSLIRFGLFAIVVFAFVVPPIMQGLVLRRVLPKLHVWLWFFGIMLSGMA